MGVEHLHDTAPAAPVGSAGPVDEAFAPAAPVALGAQQLVVGHAEDSAEVDADRQADRALARLRRRQDDSGGAEEGPDQHQHGPGCNHLRRSVGAGESAQVGYSGGALDSATSSRIQGLRGSGTALPDDVRTEMEDAFGASFSGVRIHTGAQAAGLNRQVSARAFTTGKDIFFGDGEYAPGTPDGKHTLAHELAHTLQRETSVHRLWPFSSKDDPVKKDEKEKKQQEKERQAQLKKLREIAIKKAKELEKTEKAQLKQERAIGTEERGKLKDKISQEITDKGKVEGSDSLKDLQKRFEKALGDERTLLEFLLMVPDADPEVAIQAAYDAVWMETSDKELRAIRPPRETESERLAREVRAARTEEAVTTHKQGQLLPPEVEQVYDAWECKIVQLMKADPKLSYSVASAQADTEVWQAAGASIAKQRPTDKGIERQARQTAKVRTKNGTESSSAVTSLLGKVEKKGEWVENKFGVLESGSGAVEKIVGKVGSMQDDKLQSGIPKAFETSNPMSDAPGPIGEFSSSIETAQHAKKIGVSDTDKFVGKDTSGNDLPTSVTTQASEGIGKVTGIFGDLIKGANAAIKMVKAIQEANSERDTIKILAATKATADAAGAVGTLGKDTADLAKFIDPSIAQSVASVIPGFNIAIAVTSVVSNVMTLATSGLHLSHANDSLTDARIRKPDAKKVDVLVAPMLHMTAGLTKTFEKAVWSTTQAVSSLVTSIATVASAGGFGIPAAVDAGMKVLDLLHTVGHFIADNVLAVLAQRSKEASVGALEGAAEGQFRHDPAMAVDGITTKAKKGDAVAIKFLEAYGFKPADLAKTKMADVRDAVLKEMGEDADPKTAFQSFKEKVGGAMDKWKETGELAESRNEDGKGRGFFWRVKMSLRSEESHTRSKNKTQAKTSYVVCRVGSLVLYADALKDEKEKFLDDLEKVDALTIQKAAKDPKNSEEWRKILDEAWQAMLAKGIKGQGKTPAKTP